MDTIEVIKYNAEKVEQWRYPARVLQRDEKSFLLEAWFDRSSVQVGDLHMIKGDRFLEIYFLERWYNIFEVYNGKNNQIKGWYCNISKPAVFANQSIHYIDLALDLVVLPDGQQTVLDHYEFELLQLDEMTTNKALAALSELQAMFAQINSDFRVNSWME